MAQGFTKPQKMPKIPLKNLKSAKTNFYLTFLKVSPETKICSVFDFKAKNEEKVNKMFTIFRSKTFFANFEK